MEVIMIVTGRLAIVKISKGVTRWFCLPLFWVIYYRHSPLVRFNAFLCVTFSKCSSSLWMLSLSHNITRSSTRQGPLMLLTFGICLRCVSTKCALLLYVLFLEMCLKALVMQTLLSKYITSVTASSLVSGKLVEYSVQYHSCSQGPDLLKVHFSV